MGGGLSFLVVNMFAARECQWLHKFVKILNAIELFSL